MVLYLYPQKVFGQNNSVIEVKTIIDLKGDSLCLPLNSILKFKGGKIIMVFW